LWIRKLCQKFEGTEGWSIYWVVGFGGYNCRVCARVFIES
jgi:hypothetical protein